MVNRLDTVLYNQDGIQDRLINIINRVVHVELSGGRHQARDAVNLFQGGVIVDHNFTLLTGYLGIPPDAHPNLGALAVVLKMHRPPVAGCLPAFINLSRVFLLDHADRAGEHRVRVEGHVHPYPLAVGVRLEEQAAGPGQGCIPHHLPGVFRAAFRIGANRDHPRIAQVGGAPHRAKLGINPVGAPSGMGDCQGVHQRLQVAFL